jgi:GWT1
LPYIVRVAAYNTTVLLCYFLLDLAFFPMPPSKSTYSPVSGLKVVRRPNSSNENDSDSTSTSIRILPPPSGPLHRALASGVPPGRITTAAGPSPMPAPALLEAINRNSLAIFLLVRMRLSHFSRWYANVWGWYHRRT